VKGAEPDGSTVRLAFRGVRGKSGTATSFEAYNPPQSTQYDLAAVRGWSLRKSSPGSG
jgi:hypothetical protein